MFKVEAKGHRKATYPVCCVVNPFSSFQMMVTQMIKNVKFISWNREIILQYFFIHNFIIDLVFSPALCVAARRSRVWFSTFLCQRLEFRVSEAIQVWLICYFTLTRREHEDVGLRSALQLCFMRFWLCCLCILILAKHDLAGNVWLIRSCDADL